MTKAEKGMRAAALGCALLLALVYLCFPLAASGTAMGNSGRKKLTLENGETYTWTWSPEAAGTVSLGLRFSGMKKAQDVTVHAEVLDASGAVVASADQAIGEMDPEAEGLRLEGRFEKGREYTLRLWAEGEGALKLKGEEDEETEAFYPSLTEDSAYEYRNPTLLYFAGGALLAALTPVRGGAAPRRRKEKESRGIPAAMLPWLTFGFIAGLGLFLALVKPAYTAGSPWEGWDEEIHWGAVESMSLFQEGGFRQAAGSLITWSPGYLPLALGYNLTRLFTASPEALYRGATAAEALVYAALCGLAVAKAPRYKATFMAAGMIPTFLFLMTTASYDPVVAGSLLLGAALVLEAAQGPERLSPARAIATVSLLAFGTVAKPAYSLGMMMLWMLPAERLGGKKQAWLFRGFALAMLIWCVASMGLGAYDNVIAGDERFPGASVEGQLAYMRENPLEGGLTPLRYLWASRDTLLRLGIAHWGHLGNNPQLDTVYLLLLLAAAPLGTAGETRDAGSPLTPGRRIGLAALALGVEIALAYAQYLASSEVGSATVAGMQARYFMPVWILAALALMWPQVLRKRLGKAGEWAALAVFALCAWQNLQNALMWVQNTGLMG